MKKLYPKNEDPNKALVAPPLIDLYIFEKQLSEAIKILASTRKDMSIGFPHLERYFNNEGFPKGTMTIVVAKSKVGKTFFIINCIVKILRKVKRRIAFFSLEMSSRDIIERAGRLLMGMGPRSFRTMCRVREGVDEINSQFRNIGFHEYVKLIDGKGITVKDVHEVVEDFEPEIIFIDHIHKIKPASSSISVHENIFAATSEIAESLAEMSKATNKIFIVLVQVSRGEQGKKSEDGSILPSLSAGKGSGVLEEAADVIIGMARPELNKRSDMEVQGKIEIAILGNRFGSDSPPLLYYYNPKTSEIIDEESYEDKLCIDDVDPAKAEKMPADYNVDASKIIEKNRDKDGEDPFSEDDLEMPETQEGDPF